MSNIEFGSERYCTAVTANAARTRHKAHQLVVSYTLYIQDIVCDPWNMPVLRANSAPKAHDQLDSAGRDLRIRETGGTPCGSETRSAIPDRPSSGADMAGLSLLPGAFQAGRRAPMDEQSHIVLWQKSGPTFVRPMSTARCREDSSTMPIVSRGIQLRELCGMLPLWHPAEQFIDDGFAARRTHLCSSPR